MFDRYVASKSNTMGKNTVHDVKMIGLNDENKEDGWIYLADKMPIQHWLPIVSQKPVFFQLTQNSRFCFNYRVRLPLLSWSLKRFYCIP